ncbi:MAG TPA: DUF1565 domain-containing protein, partial [Candidatus Marinimicrobia bacterium]|nr:DUF1565 domain-containing protein [Candidatus Neomarinimicrobiota bacterium]
GTVIWGDGNIDVDPVFVDTANGNYHLLASSQCINGGDPTTFDSDGSRADMGAYPYLNSYSGPTWYVAESGNDTTATGASDDPFRSIQAGINFSSDADSVTVAAGTYVENINFRGRNIKVVGADRETTIIDGNQNGSVIQIVDSDSAYIAGFTIQNGTGTSDEIYEPWVGGGGIFTKDANVNIDNCRITNCSENYRYGGGILFYPSSKSLRLTNSVIDNCSSSDAGGGLALFESGNFTFTNSRIEACYAGFAGGAMYSQGELHTENVRFINNHANSLGGAFNSDGGNSYFEHCLFSENLSGNGGGAINFGSTSNVVLNQCTLSDNDGTTRGGAIIKSGPEGTLTLFNSILQNNSDQYLSQIWLDEEVSLDAISIEYSNIQGDTIAVYHDGGEEYNLSVTNIDIPSRFISVPDLNYGLLATSFLINAGHPDSTDSDGTIADMGAYPYLNSYSGPTWYITEGGNDTTATGSSTDPFRSIQAGINFANDADSVTVAAGTYVENINFRGRNIKVAGEDRETTIIDGNQDGSVVTFDNDETSLAMLKNFTITNGSGTDGMGGGIYCYFANPYFKDIIIENNVITSVYGRGGGIFFSRSNAILEEVIIRNNSCPGSASYGGGIYFDDGSGQIIKNAVIYNNTATMGGGISLQATYNGSSTEPIFINTTLVNNNSIAPGGGIDLQNGGYATFINSVLWGNLPSNAELNSNPATSELTFQYSNVENGVNGIIVNDSCVVNWGDGNIDVDPMFVDSANGNYHLLASSMLINAGHPDSTDSDGTIADMGAYPYLNSYSGPTWYITEGGNDTTATGSSTDPFRSIQAGINFSSDGDSVTVVAGTYVENIDFNGKNIVVVGADRETTIIDGNQSG